MQHFDKNPDVNELLNYQGYRRPKPAPMLPPEIPDAPAGHRRRLRALEIGSHWPFIVCLSVVIAIPIVAIIVHYLS